MQSEATNRRANLQLTLLSVLYDKLDLFLRKRKTQLSERQWNINRSLRTKRFKIFKTRLDFEIKID